MTASLYLSGFCILLIDFVIDIARFVLSIGEHESFVTLAVGTIGASTSDVFTIITVWMRFFLSRLFGLGFLGATFLFEDGFSIGHFLRSFAPYLELSMKNLVVMMTYLV